MKLLPNLLKRKTTDKGRPDYYITPTHDFTQYTRDCAQKYWSRETAFNWGQDVEGNLKMHLHNLPKEDLSDIAALTLPMIRERLEQKIMLIRRKRLPEDEDALKDIGEYIPSHKKSVYRAMQIRSPLRGIQESIASLRDQLGILRGELIDLREQRRLGLYRQGIEVNPLETNEERQKQNQEIHHRENEIDRLQEELHRLKSKHKTETLQLKREIGEELLAIEYELLQDLEETGKILKRTTHAGCLPTDVRERAQILEFILKRQIRGLKDIANHALVVEQSAIAPLTLGLIHYRRHREIQEAMTTFINDEAKHSATFRRFLVEKLQAKEYVSDDLIKGANRYMWVSRFMPGSGMFLAVIVEAIGAATLEFFAQEKYMPDPLFRSICKTISTQDEKRHMDLCVAMYNELFRKGSNMERWRNKLALKVIMQSVYGDKTEDHPLIQAFRAFGVESRHLYGHVAGSLSQQLSRISLYVEPGTILGYIGQK